MFRSHHAVRSRSTLEILFGIGNKFTIQLVVSVNSGDILNILCLCRLDCTRLVRGGRCSTSWTTRRGSADSSLSRRRSGNQVTKAIIQLVWGADPDSSVRLHLCFGVRVKHKDFPLREETTLQGCGQPWNFIRWNGGGEGEGGVPPCRRC